MYAWVPNQCHLSGRRARSDAQGVRSMGRGRQKAKQTKVARDLKYYSPPTDLSALQRELQSQRNASNDSGSTRDPWSDDSDDWADEDAPSARRR